MNEKVKGLIVFGLIVGSYVLGFTARGWSVKQEVKEETIKRMAYALQSGMVTVNHDKIVEISKVNKERIQKVSEAIQSQVDTNQVTEKSEDNFGDLLDSNSICSTNNENKIKIPEEG